MNALFLLLMLAAAGDPAPIAERVRSAYASGDLQGHAFLPYDARRGYLQFNDCNILQMLTNPDARLGRALAPKVFRLNEDWEGQCRLLRSLVVDKIDTGGLLLLRYSRYWHGYNTVAAVGLRAVELRTLRRGMSAAVWISIGLLALAGFRAGGQTRRTALFIAATTATVWGVPYFSPGFTFGPGDTSIFLGLVALVSRKRLTSSPKTLVPYAAGFGAVVVFFEMLTGQLPIAIVWLAAVTLAAARDREPSSASSPARAAAIAALAFILGAAATVVAKQALAMLLAEPGAAADFLGRLRLYMGRPETATHPSGWIGRVEDRLPVFLSPFTRLVLQSPMLTYGSRRAGYLLLAVTAAAWVASVVRLFANRGEALVADELMLFGASLVTAVWVFFLPRHTATHAAFMVRLLIIPISLAPMALTWPIRRGHPAAFR